MAGPSVLIETPVFNRAGSWALLFCATCLLSPAPVHAQTVLERVLQKITVSGLFVNAAQSGFASDSARIDASITNLISAQIPESAGVEAWTPVEVAIGNMESVALGATNAGEHIFGISAQISPSDQQDVTILPDVMGASTVLYGANSTAQHEIDLARIDELIALSMRSEFETWQSGTGPETTVAALNFAANRGDVTARVLNRAEAVKFAALDISSTAIGSVNAGIAKVIGNR